MPTTYWNKYNRKALQKAENKAVQPEQESTKSLEDMTKAELLDEANRQGVDVNKSATKAEILDALGA